MSTPEARSAVLARIRAALTDRPTSPIPRDYRRPGTRGPGDLTRFAEVLRDYRAQVHLTDNVPAAIAATGRDLRAAPGCPPEWGGRRGTPSIEDLDRCDGVITACHTAIADTGTIVLDHAAPDQGPRAFTLVPDYHLVVVRADQIVAGVPDAVAALAGVATQTWISGPSATSDIELERVEGVHGPRTLEVVIETG
ncbi:lactate utilization protein C [Actinokineospora guangxiensis]|uniref:Lactate utilization protein C n=1 Tax=Actinokineospora guangxiensis TaxID=1490288 RepID=A0ABW0EVV5_9PSEU